MESFMQLLGGGSGDELDITSPQSWAYLIMLAISLLYGVTLCLLHNVYFKDSDSKDEGLARSFIFLTPTLMTIFWVVQFSLPLSVGLVGTLSFVRFRSPVKRAEDVSFIVISLASAISCAVGKPLMGGALMLVFLCYALGRNHRRPDKITGSNSVVITYNTKKGTGFAEIENVLREANCAHYHLLSSTIKDGVNTVVFRIPSAHSEQLGLVTNKLESADTQSEINILFPQPQINA